MDSFDNISPTARFGEELRKAREFRHMSLREVAEITRVSLEYLSALERGDVEILPQPIRRGIVAAYANAVAMNRDLVLRDFEALFDPQSEKREAVLLRGRRKESLLVGMTRAQIRTAWFARLSSNRRLHWILTATLIAVGAAGALLARRQLTDTNSADPVKLNPAFAYDSSRFVLPFREIREALVDSPVVGISDWEVRWTEVIALDTAVVDVRAGLDSLWIGIMYPYDTITFIHLNGLRAEVEGGPKLLALAEGDTVPWHTLRDSVLFFYTVPFELEQADSLVQGDSLKKGD
ncbi:helix-turn-helix domain-containing protein [bacterium]|nr:helix-turn-helix domain-containing protein [bacterium]